MAVLCTKTPKHLLVILIIAAILPISACSKDPAKNKPFTGTRKCTLTYSFTVEDIDQNAKTVKAWIPIPLTSSRQHLTKTDIQCKWPCKITQTAESINKFLIFDLSKACQSPDNSAEITVNFTVTRNAVNALNQNQPKEKLTQTQIDQYLAPDTMIPVDGIIATQAASIVPYKTDNLKKAKSLYDHIVSTVIYDKTGQGWGRGDAIYACNVRKGNCTDFHSLFIGQARSLSIPSRFIMGLPLPEDRSQGQIAGYHCWAEFYIDKKGWIPIDASEAQKHPEKAEKFFGGLDAHRIAFTIGRDIKLPESKLDPVNYIIYPHVEVDGVKHDNVNHAFRFEDIN